MVDRIVITAVVGEAQRIHEHTLNRRVAEIGVVVVGRLLAAESGEGIQHGATEVVEDKSPINALRPMRFFLLVLSLLLLLLLPLLPASGPTRSARPRRV